MSDDGLIGFCVVARDKKEAEAMQARITASDLIALMLLVIFPAAVYITGLGFHSDDWFFQSYMHFLPDQSAAGLFSGLIVHETLAPRPGQVVILESLYMAFGRDPFWGHLINHAVLFASGAVLYLAMRRAQPSRLLAFLVVAVYLCMPNYTTARLWFANYQAILSLFCFALASYAWVRSSRADAGIVAWQVAGFVAAAASALSYEYFMPLLVGSPIVIVLLRLLDDASEVPVYDVVRRMAVAVLCALVVVAAAAFYKLATFSVPGQWTFAQWRELTYNLYDAASRLAFWDLGFKLPLNVARMLAGPAFRLGPVLAGIAVGLVVYLALGRIGADDRRRGLGFGSLTAALVALVVGLATFSAGYAVLLQNFYADMTPTGINNRHNVAASVGVAIVAVAGAAIFDLAAGERLRRFVTFPLAAILCGMGIVLNATVGVFWAEAAVIQEGVYGRLRAALPELPAGASVVLAGVCPYHGPAPVFTSSWDLSGRLRIDTGKPDLLADVLTSNSAVSPTGVQSSEYEVVSTYPFGKLWVYDDRTGQATRLADFAAAEVYFQAHPIGLSAPCKFEEGAGERLF